MWGACHCVGNMKCNRLQSANEYGHKCLLETVAERTFIIENRSFFSHGSKCLYSDIVLSKYSRLSMTINAKIMYIHK